MKTTHHRSACILVVLGACSFAACSAEAPTGEDVETSADGLSKAAFTTFVDADECLHGNGNGINCNHYASKQGVYMNGGPTGNVLPDGQYYFTVLEPGAQNGGFVDGADGNLSDTTPADGTGDLFGARTFTMQGGNVVYNGPHDQSGATPNGKNAIGLYPFDDTSNNGGVYILAICKINPRDPRDCKYDMFKVTEPICGDGEVHGDEECEWDEDCDEGYSCESCECVRDPYCGDGNVDEGEDCEDDSDCGAYESCEACQCEPDPYCGDGNVDAGEDCDDGNDDNTDACTDECECATCGDGYVWEGEEECESDSDCGAYETCSACKCEAVPYCGDGHVDAGEQCDGSANTECLYGCDGDCSCAECVTPEYPESCTPGEDDCGPLLVCDPYACECVCPGDVTTNGVD